MSDMPKHVHIKEVGPREGFQFEKGDISLERKISLVDALSGTGVKTIEFTSFVSPKWVPQMADAEQMVAGIRRAPGVAYEAIWLNEAGLERAARLRESLALRPMFGVAASDVFMRKNTNRSVDEKIAELPGWAGRYRDLGMAVLEKVEERATGCGRFDSAVAGMGGCPFAAHKGAAGNVTTEDLVFLCQELGIETGIDLDAMIEAGQLAERVVGHPLPGKLKSGGNLEKYRARARAAATA